MAPVEPAVDKPSRFVAPHKLGHPPPNRETSPQAFPSQMTRLLGLLGPPDEALVRNYFRTSSVRLYILPASLRPGRHSC